jgi:hypothetical protein
VGVVVAVSLPGSSGSTTATRTSANTPAPIGLTTSGSTPAAGLTSTVGPPATPHPPATTTPPTTDPGALPQTTQLPGAGDPLFLGHVRDLWQAVVDGQPHEAGPFFFPLSAYIQVKGISDPVHDYQSRLVADFNQDVETLHASLGPAAASATFTGVSVPDAAEWIGPGVEDNKGSYWRVYGTRVAYTFAGRAGSFEITSMISWRGEWYVVHLGQIR